jgi:hypothetical protein
MNNTIWSRSRFRLTAFLLGKENKDNYLDKDNSRSIFYGELPVLPRKSYEHGIPNFVNNKIDGVPEYTSNSLGYRSPEFFKDVDTIFVGDSHTYGIGLPDRFIWTNILAKSLGFSYVNLAMPGASTQSCVSNVMFYIKKYGKPKNIFCAFPDMGRMVGFINDDTATARGFKNTTGIVGLQLEPNADLSAVPSFMKKPYEIDQVIPLEMAVMNSLKDIRFLEQYCQEAGINLFWTCFNTDSHYMIRLMTEKKSLYYDSFVDTYQDKWTDTKNGVPGEKFYTNFWFDDKKEPILCHEGYRQIAGNLFDFAGDTDSKSSKSQKPHYGAHRNLHLAEAMEEAYKNATGN